MLVQLLKADKIIGTGTICRTRETVHGYNLIPGWACVEIRELFQPTIPCWDDFPTFSGEIEVGSFSAWPCDQLVAFEDKGNSPFGCSYNRNYMGAPQTALV